MQSPRYYVTVVGGLEEVAWGELQEKLAAPRLVRQERGRLFFDSDSSPRELLGLRSVENVHAYVGEFGDITAEEGSLPYIREQLAQMALDDQVAMYESAVGPKPDPSFRVTTKRTGTHDFNSTQVAAFAGAGVIDRYGWRVDLTGHDLEVRVDIRQDTCLVGLRLSDETMSRRSRLEHAPASLKSTVAHCMIRLIGWAEDDVFLDPMCGAGTLLVERIAFGRPKLLMGGDRDEASLAKAAINLQHAVWGRQPACREVAERSQPDAAHLLRWDARRLPLARGSVNRITCNLPWGRRIGSHRVNVHLYPAFVHEMGWLLAEGGHAALLTAEKRLITRLIHRDARLSLVDRCPIKVGGMRATIYLVRRD